MPLCWITWCTKPNTGEIAKHMVTFRPFCPHTWRYALSPLSERPWFLAVQMLNPHSSTNIGWWRLASSKNQLAYSWRRWITSARLRSVGSGPNNFRVYNIPSKCFATVRTWTVGFSGRRSRNFALIASKVNVQLSLIIASRHWFISLSNFTLFLPPRGRSSTLFSRMYLEIMLLAVERLTPNASATMT